eukprot:TRINITY_DN120780_c0_g1_i1.p1 TRINITY_DN120780_c0_g1~~TRINITY_DN120780_c0_g1_i1.p1  ORF type:complete len:657 (+),score=94.62 TRINITY_DN120780_c0_g1_i1:188-2158(+)
MRKTAKIAKRTDPGKPKKRPLEETKSPKIEQTSKRAKLDLPIERKLTKESEHSQPAVAHKLTDALYHPINDAPFSKGESVPFNFIVESLAEIEQVKGAKSKAVVKEVLSNVFRTISLLSPTELAPAYYFYTLRLAPEYMHKETGIGHETLIKAIARVAGRSEKEIREHKVKIGDLGLVLAESREKVQSVESFFTKKKEKKLALTDVMQTFNKIAESHGANSQGAKLGLLSKILFDADKYSAKYIVRWAEGNLKVGAAEQTVITALARAVSITPFDGSEVDLREKLTPVQFKGKVEKNEKAIKRALCEYPNYEALMEALVKVGNNTDKLSEYCYIRPGNIQILIKIIGTPVKPMLSKPTKGVKVVLKRFEGMKFTCEYKYDGFRAQVHYWKGPKGESIVKVFSRNLEDMTEAYPDVIDFINESAKGNVKDFIMDSEIVAYDRKKDKILPFQNLTTRARKKIHKKAVEVDICVFGFDLLYLNGKSLLSQQFQERRELLYSHFNAIPQKFQFAKHLDTINPEEMEVFMEKAIKSYCEGLMVKTLTENSEYEPSKRSSKWLKLKKDYIETGIGDTLDLVVVGADYGKGKRTGMYGSFLLAVYDKDTATYQTTSKLGTGLSDEQLKDVYKEFQELKTTKIPSLVRHKGEVVILNKRLKIGT